MTNLEKNTLLAELQVTLDAANTQLAAAEAAFAAAQAELTAAVVAYDAALAIVPDPEPPEIWLNLEGQVQFTEAPEGYTLETLVPDHTGAGGWSNGFGANPTPNTGGIFQGHFIIRHAAGHLLYDGPWAEATFQA